MTKKKLALALILSACTLSGCGDESSGTLTKVALTAAGGAGGALLGNKLSSSEDKTLSTVLGGVAGGALGYIAGGLIN